MLLHRPALAGRELVLKKPTAIACIPKCQMAGWDVSRGIIAGIEGRMRHVSDFELLILARVLKTEVGALYPKRVDWASVGLHDVS